MLEASAFQALQVWTPYRGRNKPPVELVVHDLDILCEQKENSKASENWEVQMDDGGGIYGLSDYEIYI